MLHYFTVALQLTGISTISNGIYCLFPWFNFLEILWEAWALLLIHCNLNHYNVNIVLGGDIVNNESSLEVSIKNITAL